MKFENNLGLFSRLLKFLGYISGLVIFISMFFIIWTRRFYLIKNNYVTILSIIVLIAVLALLKVKSLNIFYNGFKEFSKVIITTVNFILLSIVYILGVGLTSLIAKFFNKHFLDLKKKDVKSYYNDKKNWRRIY